MVERATVYEGYTAVAQAKFNSKIELEERQTQSTI